MSAEQLLQNMHRVLSHDLPNQMVALSSLMQLLKSEESNRLSSDGREYLRRLQAATQHAGAMVRFLKEMARLNAVRAKAEPIDLSTLGRELQGELQRQHPKIEFKFAWQWSAPSVIGDLRTFAGAILEISGCFLHKRVGPCTVRASSKRLPTGIELAFLLDQSGPEQEDLTPTPVRWNPQTLEQRMEINLARAWLALSGASVEFPPASSGVRFVIVVTDRATCPNP